MMQRCICHACRLPRDTISQPTADWLQSESAHSVAHVVRVESALSLGDLPQAHAGLRQQIAAGIVLQPGPCSAPSAIAQSLQQSGSPELHSTVEAPGGFLAPGRVAGCRECKSDALCAVNNTGSGTLQELVCSVGLVSPDVAGCE